MGRHRSATFRSLSYSDTTTRQTCEVQTVDADLVPIWYELPEWARVWIRQFVIALARVLELEPSPRRGEAPPPVTKPNGRVVTFAPRPPRPFR